MLGPLAAVSPEWVRCTMLVASLLTYFCITVWVGNFGSGSASGPITIVGCGLTLALALMAMVAADKWLAPMLPSMPDTTVVLVALAVTWIAVCAPLIAVLFGIKYGHALIAWMIGMLSGWLLAHLLVYLWGSILGGKVNIDKLRQINQTTKSAIGG